MKLKSTEVTLTGDYLYGHVEDDVKYYKKCVVSNWNGQLYATSIDNRHQFRVIDSPDVLRFIFLG